MPMNFINGFKKVAAPEGMITKVKRLPAFGTFFNNVKAEAQQMAPKVTMQSRHRDYLKRIGAIKDKPAVS